MEIKARKKRITVYFNKGYTQREIVLCLFLQDGMKISERQLRRHLKELGLNRTTTLPFTKLYDLVKVEIKESGSLLGYRNMYQRLKVINKIQISRNCVMKLQSAIDPQGVQLRKLHRLKRRKYFAKGPNYLWHLDGYDKLKRFGFCIHGCIDGFSRKILWLHVSSSNNCPKIIASYFIDAVMTFQGLLPNNLASSRTTQSK